jgi:uncharacterized caspase-like protein
MSLPGLAGNRAGAARLEVQADAEGNSANPITGLRLLLDGRPVASHALPAPQRGRVAHTFSVDLPPGTHRLSVKASGTSSDGNSDEREVTFAAAGAQAPGNLYLLAVGINAYPGRLRLDAAVPDAQEIARAFKQYSSRLFRDIQVKLLLDEKATRRAILDGLDWLQQQARPSDVAVMFYAGHGDCKLADQFYLLPVDVNVRDLPATGVSRDVLKSKLGSLPSSTLLLLDACFSGSFDQRKKKRALPNAADATLRDLVYDEGLVVMCGAAKEHTATEEKGHGYFTQALVAGLSGQAPRDENGLVDLDALQLYVTRQVLKLSGGEQAPTIGRPSTVRSFALARPEEKTK